MNTGDKYTNITHKRLMGYDSFKTYFLDFLKDSMKSFVAQVYNKDGTFHATTKVAITASGNDEFDLSDDKEGTDGSGHLLTTDRSAPFYDAYCDDVQFENTNAIVYDVALHYAEMPSGIQINPRTGMPEFQRYEEVVGVSDDPANVTDDGDGTITIRLPTSLCENDRSHVNRKCAVWKKVPGAGATTESVAVEILDVQYSTFNYVETATAFGQTTISTTDSDYTVLLLGPTVTRQTEKDLEAAADYWYIGEVTGAGVGNPPSTFDTANQRLITKSLSDLLDYLVYSNVENTFTQKQTFTPSEDEEAIVATGGSTSTAIDGTGGGTAPGVKGTGATGIAGYNNASGGQGGYFTGQSNGNGGVGTTAASSGYAGLKGQGPGGSHGVIAEGKASTPFNSASLKVTPQGGDPTSPEDGDHWQNTADDQAKTRVNGTTRTYAEDKAAVRTFLYPLACAMADDFANPAAPDWEFRGGVDRFWASQKTGGYLICDLNRFVPNGATITQIRVYWQPYATDATETNRMQMTLNHEQPGGSITTEETDYADNTTSAHWTSTGAISHTVNTATDSWWVTLRDALTGVDPDYVYALEIKYTDGDYLTPP